MSSRFLRVIRISFLWPCSILSIAALAQNNAIFGFGFFATETYVNNIYLADLNGDGVPDLIETYSSLTPNGFSIQLAKGDGTFAAAVTHLFPVQNQGPIFLTTADVNRDGKTDVIVAINPDTTSPQGTLLVYLGRGDGTFAAPKSKNIASSIHALDRADFNRDGKVDLAVDLIDSTAGERVALMYGNGFGGFSAPFRVMPIAANHTILSLAIGDFDADSHADIAVSVINPPCPNPGYCVSTNVYIAYGNGAGSFAKKLVFSGVPGNFTFASGDMNLDGRTDLEGIFFAGTRFNNVVILYGQKSRTVTSARLTVPNSMSQGLTGVVADFNGDGHNDFATFGFADQGDFGLDLFLGNASGTFTAQQVSITSTGFVSNSQFVVGDFNRDRKPDLLFARTCGPSSFPGCLTDSTSLQELVNATPGGFFSTCAFPKPAAGIHMCKPASESTVASPVHFTVTADGFEPIRKMELWVDGTKLAEQHRGWDKYAWFDFKHSFAAGTHRANIFSAGYDNTLQHRSVTFTVP